MNEFIALSRGLRESIAGLERKKSPGRRLCRERMHPQSTDGSALRLHSCRALSSETVRRR